MAHKGQIIKDPHTGEWIAFVETAKETKGRYTTFKVLQKAGGFKPVLHLHTAQDETFTILQGELTYIFNGETKTVGAGKSVTLPKGHPHSHYNEGKEDLVMLQTISPSLDFDTALENLYGLATEGKLPNGEPQFLQVMVWLRNFESKTYLARVPVKLQDLLSFLLAPIGRMFGYKAVYKKFSGFDS